jgi:two-component system cell cycle sensor histidine kinase/response regulator CckA
LGATAVSGLIRAGVIAALRGQRLWKAVAGNGSAAAVRGEMLEQPAQHDELAANGQFGGFRWVVGAAAAVWTDGLCRLLGVDRKQADQSLIALTAIIHADDRQRFVDMLHIVGTDGHAQYCDVRALHGDGQTIHCRIEVQPELGPDAEVTTLIGIVQDVTEVRRTKEALRRSQSLLRAIIDAIPAAITVKDREGRFVLVNAYEADYHGQAVGWFTGRALADMFAPEDAARIAGRDRAVIESGETLEVEQIEATDRYRRLRTWVERKAPIRDESGAVTHVVTIDLDITERVQAEAASRHSAALLRAVVDSVPALVSVTDGGGRYIFVNAHAASYHRRAADWFPGKMIEDVHPLDYARLLRERDKSALRQERSTGPYEEVYTEADGRQTNWLSSDVPIQPESGSAPYVVSASIDITERKRNESAVRESRNLLRAIIDAVPMTVHVKDTDGRYVLVNADMAAELGQQAESLIGKRADDVFPEAYARQVREREQHLIVTGEATPLFEEEYRDHGGRSSTWLARKVPLRDDHGMVKYIVSVGLDITDRKKAEETVRESQSLLRAIIDAVPATVTVKDLKGRYVIVNAYQAQYLSRPIEWFEGRSVADVYPADYVRAIEERDRLVAATGETHRFYETDYRGPDGELSSWIGIRAPIRDGAGKIRYVVSIGLDITDRRRSELALEQSERRFRHLVESSDVVPYTWDIDSRRFLYVGPQIERMLGVRPEVLKYQEQWLSMILPEDREVARQHASSFNEGPRDEYFEYRVLHSDGRVMWVRDIIKIETREDGSRVGFGFIFDITESKSREQQLAQAQKMDAVGKLTGGVAHDFNNLLTVILGSLELLELSVGDDAQGLARIRLASEAARRGADLTQRLLAFARQQMLAPRVVNLNECVASMGELLRRTLGESITIRMQLAADLWLVRVDPTWFESAVLNLAVNGRDAMPDGGTLTIETTNQQFDETVSWQGTDIAPGRYVALLVSDTGTGMTPEILARAFDPFFTTKEVGKGTGLGLSMVYGFVKQSGGHVRIYSEVGLGTTVKIHLPAGGSAGEGERLDADNPERAPSGQETILVVEDDDSVRGTIVAMLQSLGYRVLTAADGASGLKAIERHAEIAVLLTDVIMPGKLNGPALAREATKRLPGVRVLYMSGYAENAFGPGGVQGTGSDLLAKPFSKRDLARKIRDILGAGTP